MKLMELNKYHFAANLCSRIAKCQCSTVYTTKNFVG